MAERKQLPIPLGVLDVQTPDIEADDGLLRLVKNLIRRGSERHSYLSPAEKEKEVYERDDVEAALRGVRAIHVQVRQRIGSLTSETGSEGTAIAAGWYAAGQDIYDDGATTFTVRNLLTVAFAHGLAALGGYVYRYGGQSGTSSFTSKLERFTPGDAAWAARASGLRTYWAGGLLADTIGNQLLMFANGSAHVDAYDPVANSWANLTSASPKNGTGLWYTIDTENRLVFFGGGSANTNAYVYDIAANDFTAIAAPATIRQYARAHFYEGKVYLFGGYNGSASVGTMQVYDPGTNTWAAEVSMDSGSRHTFASALIGSRVFVAAGERAGTGTLADVWVYDIETSTWGQLADIPTGSLVLGGGVELGGYFFVAGGNHGGASFGTNNVQVYVPLGSYVPGQEPVQALPSSSERIIAVTDTHIYALEPAASYAPTELYEYPDALKGRKKVQFTQIGDVTFIATSVGGGLGLPTPVLVLVDDQVMPFELPPLPAITITENAAGGSLAAGRYGVRFAWILKDGTVAKASRPYTINVSANAELQFAIAAYREALASYWSEIISGVQIAVSQAAETSLAIELMNRPYYQVAQIRGLAVGKSASWSDAGDNIPGYPLFEDDTLMNHEIHAAAVTSYNKRLVLGDIATNFEQPDPLAQAINPDGIGTSTNEAPTFSWWFIDEDDDGLLDDETTTRNMFTCVGTLLEAAIEIEDPDGLLTRTAYDDSNDPGGDTLPGHAVLWEGWNGSSWDFLIFGDREDTTPGYQKKRLRIFWTPGPEWEGRGVNFKVIGEDDDFGYSESSYSIGVFPAGFCDG